MVSVKDYIDGSVGAMVREGCFPVISNSQLNITGPQWLSSLFLKDATYSGFTTSAKRLFQSLTTRMIGS